VPVISYQPVKRHSRNPPLQHRGAVKNQYGDSDGPLYYARRPDELPESAPDIAFLLGESDIPLPLTTAHTEEDKPVRLLHDWAVFDARPSKDKDSRGALALELISLHALDSTDVGCAPEGAGVASPYCENEEDAGQEDDGGYDDDGSSGDEEEGTAVSVRLRLGALLRWTIDYTKRDEYVSFPFHLLLCGHGRGSGVDAIVLGCVARYTSRLPWPGTYLALPRPSIALSSCRSFVRIKSRRPSCARSCASRTPTWTHLSLSFSLRSGWLRTISWVPVAAGQTCVMYRMRYVSLLGQVRRRTSSNSPGTAVKDSDDHGGA